MMKAITVEPGKPGSALYSEFPEPEVNEGSILVEAVAVGVCGTDVEIVEGKYGWTPPGSMDESLHVKIRRHVFFASQQ